MKKYFPIFIESCIILIVFHLFYFFKVGGIYFPSKEYFLFEILFYLSWISAGIFWGKYNPFLFIDHKAVILILSYQFIFTIIFLPFISAISPLNNISRLFLFKINISNYLIQLVLQLYLVFKNRRFQSLKKPSIEPVVNNNISIKRAIASFLLLVLSFWANHIFFNSFKDFYQEHELTLFVLIFSWVSSSLLTGKFIPQNNKNYFYKIAPFVKAAFLMPLLIGAIYYWNRLDSELIPKDLIFTTLIFITIEVMFALVYFKYKKDDLPKIKLVKTPHFHQHLLTETPNQIISEPTFIDQVKSISFPHNKKIIHHLSNYFSEFRPSNFKIIFDRHTFNINLYKPESVYGIFNYCKINDIQFKDVYLRSCYRVLEKKGYIIALYTPQNEDTRIIKNKMPKSIFTIYYPFRYVLRRVFPKLPFFQNYILLSRMVKILSCLKPKPGADYPMPALEIFKNFLSMVLN